MAEYVFMLVRDFQLSILEIASYFSARNIAYKIKAFDSKVALISFNEEIDCTRTIKKLGGTIKIAKLIASVDDIKLPDMDKIKYSIADIGSARKNEVIIKLKKRFKENGSKAYLKDSVNGLSPSDFFRHNIFKTGFELILYKEHLALTRAVFNPSGYEARDKRPYLEREKLTSIRLAKILVNLSHVKENEKLLDPFCGVATILQEALLMGIEAIGMDVDKKTLYHANKNLTWLRNKYKFKANFLLVNKDARSASSYIEKVDGIATEPYLGPYLRRLPELKEAKRTALGLARLYNDSLKEFHATLKPKGKVAIIIPKFKTKEQVPVRINFEGIARQNKFLIYKPFKGISMPVLYSPKGTKLAREIYILEKV